MNRRVVSPAGPRPRGFGRAGAPPAGRAGRSWRGGATSGISSSSAGPPTASCGQLHGRERDLHHVELVGEGLDHDAEAVELVAEDGLAQRGAHQLQAPRAQVGDGRDLLDLDAPAGHALDVLEHAVLARLGQGDGDALAPGAADAADAVHVGVGGRGHVVVDDVGELLDVEPAGRHVGRDQQLGRAAAQAVHDAVALLLGHAAVQGLGAVAATVERLGRARRPRCACGRRRSRRRAPPRRGCARGPPACGRATARRRSAGPADASPAAARSRRSGCAPGRAGGARRSRRCARASWPRRAPSGAPRGWR